MKWLKFSGIYQKSGWVCPAFIQVDEQGKILQITQEAQSNAEEVKGYAVPSVPNAHSHSFQYAMAGLAEVHDGDSEPDDFWSWREAMYNLALSVNPDEFEAIATKLYSEMLRHGYGSVAEFHYVHHDQNGQRYNNHAELGQRLVNAAQKVGLKINLIPIFYQKGGFGQPPVEKQKRFISPTTEDYLSLFEASVQATKSYKDASCSIGLHSMRGVDQESIKEAVKAAPQGTAIHIHVSEQLKEIDDSIAYLGKRPVEWLLDNVEMNEYYQLVHATHLTAEEVTGIAKSKAQVVICPTTEGNLGDGFFQLKSFQEQGGRWCIGTDSHVSLNPLEELRLLDYGQRMLSHKRNTYYTTGQGDAGAYAFQHTIDHGRVAMNLPAGDYFQVGQPLDAFVMKENSSLLSVTGDKFRMSSILYSTDQSMVLGTLSNGEWKVKDNVHQLQEEIDAEFQQVMKSLKSRY